jgi:hypothetical protein
MDNTFKMPTEIVDLPSQGLVYPESSPLSKGEVEMKYMTAKEEDILTNQNYISKGTVFDELIKSLVVSDIDHNELITGDKNAILIAARVLGYGKDYSFMYNDEEYNIDLSLLENRPLKTELFQKGINEFDFTLPASQIPITFKLLTGKDDKKINAEIEGLKKINKMFAAELSTRLKYIITSIGGNRESKDIREFVDNKLLARDSRALREYIKEIQPDIDLTFFPNGSDKTATIPLGLNFFWPDI